MMGVRCMRANAGGTGVPEIQAVVRKLMKEPGRRFAS